MKDIFVLIAPGKRDSRNRSVIRLEPHIYDKVSDLSRDTGLTMCRIVSQAVEFAFDHMEEDDNADPC